MTLQNKKKVEVLSITIGIIAGLMFIGSLLQLNYYSSLPYPWSIPIQLNSSINLMLFCLLLHFAINNKNLPFIKYCSVLLIINNFMNLVYLMKLDSNLLNLLYLNPFFNVVIIERYTNIKPCLASIFCYILIGFSFLGILSKSNFFNRTAQAALHLVTLIAILAILGLADNLPSLEQIYFFSNFSIYGAFLLILISIMIATLQPNLGFVTIFIGSKIGNEISRSLFPEILLSVLILGYLRIEIAKTDLLNEASANVLLQTSYILVTLLIIYVTKDSLNKIDDQRKKAEDKVVVTNRTLEKKIKKRTIILTKQNEQLEKFAYVVSHNFKAPVSNLHSLIEIYQEVENSEEKDLLLEKFKITVTTLTDTLNDLLKGISIKNDSKREKEHLVFDSFFFKTLNFLKGDIIKLEATITSDFSKAPSLEYPAIYLESIMLNLMSNALRYSSPVRIPKINFQSQIINNKIVLTVCDNGLGINLKEHGKDIFGFKKVFHKHPDSKGVGLFLVKAQIEGMGGKISIKSRVNLGTTFKIIF